MAVLPVFSTKIDELRVKVYGSNNEMGLAGSELAVEIIVQAVKEKGRANLILASANSQLSFLDAFGELPGIDWKHLNFFHMDEYIGIGSGHPASFSAFLCRHLFDRITPGAFYPIPTEGDIDSICRDYEQLLRTHPADLCVMGIGENGHVAFNDPPYADFHDHLWVKPVEIDDVSRLQQVKEGHFEHIDSVPRHAVTLTIPALLAARHILVLVPEKRKADAVYKSLFGPIVETCPASVLRDAAHAQLLLDADSACRMFFSGLQQTRMS